MEHDAGEIWSVTQAVAGEALDDAGVRPGDLAAVGIANQRETVCVWDPSTGEPLHNAIVWQDRRTAARCEELRAAGHEPLIRARTGLVLDPYFSATKIAWLLENVDGLRERAHDGTAVFGTVDSWLIFKLAGEHVTDATNASRTLLYDIAAGRWDPELLELFEVPPARCPSPSERRGNRRDPAGALHGHAVPIAGVAGDQQAALFGQACVDPGMAKATYGTGSFVLLNTPASRARAARAGLLATVASEMGRGRAYALEASIFVTGAAVQWLRDELRIIERAEDTERLAASLDSNDDVYFVPALTGLGSPHWDPTREARSSGSRAGPAGPTSRARHSRRSPIRRGTRSTRWKQASGLPLGELRADGGASVNGWLMQFQADVLGCPVVVGESTETTALGAAYLAGVGVGLWTVSDVRDSWREGARYEPRMGEDERAGLLAGWADALDRAASQRA